MITQTILLILLLRLRLKRLLTELLLRRRLHELGMGLSRTWLELIGLRRLSPLLLRLRLSVRSLHLLRLTVRLLLSWLLMDTVLARLHHRRHSVVERTLTSTHVWYRLGLLLGLLKLRFCFVFLPSSLF